jgi:hypothetical protein
LAPNGRDRARITGLFVEQVVERVEIAQIGCRVAVQSIIE